jgi:hypothetical protein
LVCVSLLLLHYDSREDVQPDDISAPATYPRHAEAILPTLARLIEIGAAMLCEKCKLNEATSHRVGWSRIHGAVINIGRIEEFERHLCEACATELRRIDPIVNPSLMIGLASRRFKVCVLRADTEQTLVRLTATEQPSQTEECVFLTSRFPSSDSPPVIGEEFEMYCTVAELEWMKGARLPSQSE